MKKYTQIVIAIVIVILMASVAVWKKESKVVSAITENIGDFSKVQSCVRHPNFLAKLKISQPVAIDLSQKQYKGLAFLYGQGLSQVLHLKTWEKFDYFSTYTLDPMGNMYLTPMPFISVNENTFEFQKNIYILDSNSGKLSIWMNLDEVEAGSTNPYGVIAVEYDCKDNTLWVSSIDKTNYKENKGTIYHIDIASKKVLKRIKGVDALSLKLVQSKEGKFLLFGGARENILYALETKSLKTKKLFELPNTHEHIRKIKVRSDNLLELQTILFSYSLIAETSHGEDRKYYQLEWNALTSWELTVK